MQFHSKSLSGKMQRAQPVWAEAVAQQNFIKAESVCATNYFRKSSTLDRSKMQNRLIKNKKF